MSSEVVKLEVSDHVAVATLNRPPVNAVNAEMRNRIIEIFDEVTDRDDIRVVVLTGRGRIFCAGADLKQRPDPGKAGAFWHHNRITRETGNAIKECSKPVIAAVNGAALGAGFGLMAACDIMLASDTAVFGMPEIDVGLAGGAAMLNELLGKSFARRLMFTGDRLPASELHRLGVIDSVWPADELMPAAMAMATRIAQKSPLGIRYAKTSCNMVELMPAKDAYRFEQNFTYELSKTEDAKEARTAQLEKRKPVFKGR
ncbi:enoyl-CoA hydratase/isomerase family protein [Falsiroseomonas sp.]|uniref:enoyl-CoA hydratase/isomerase family protein n=1 Tax=Falsiroseomonas sp. TaxID=2870721 RepID=UPI00271EE436|nr:enoyl-CoA hydratase/isomerase family protein [Falsiroseomonas sp.]MDO9500154.1 enoyl-CoA hydratase/isomerase family protein [Falsiroseomonas sp.]